VLFYFLKVILIHIHHKPNALSLKRLLLSSLCVRVYVRICVYDRTEITETPAHIDRYMAQLMLGGHLKQIAGFVFGQLISIHFTISFYPFLFILFK
jgi:hypothetical protein